MEVNGWDPKLVKAHRNPFYKVRHGTTTLSATGLCLTFSPGKSVILVPVCLLYSFLKESARDKLSEAEPSSLIDSACIEVLCSDNKEAGTVKTVSPTSGIVRQRCALVGFLHLPEVASFAGSVIRDLQGAGGTAWRYGWTIASDQSPESTLPQVLGTMGLLATVSEQSANTPGPLASDEDRQKLLDYLHRLGTCSVYPGQRVLIRGSPFGCLAPYHFLNTLVEGHVANTWGTTTASADQEGQGCGVPPPLFLLDAHCLPGMEGAPVLCACGQLCGVLTLPLANTTSKVEMPLAVSLHWVLAALRRWISIPPTNSPGPAVDVTSLTSGTDQVQVKEQADENVRKGGDGGMQRQCTDQLAPWQRTPLASLPFNEAPSPDRKSVV